MDLHSLKPKAGSVKKRKRIARGPGSGSGGTSGKGHKGQKSRSGYSRKRNFEGGQMPIQMRLPKRGFKNHNRVDYTSINLSQLQAWADKFGITTIDENFYSLHNVLKKEEKIKVLGDGTLSTTLLVKAHAFSNSAQKAIEASGGSIEVL